VALLKLLAVLIIIYILGLAVFQMLISQYPVFVYTTGINGVADNMVLMVITESGGIPVDIKCKIIPAAALL